MAYVVQSDIETANDLTLTGNGIALVNNLLIPNLSQAIDNYCNRTWTNPANTPLTELFDAGTDTFFVSQPNIDPTKAITVSVGGVPWSSNYIFNYKTHVKLYTSPQTILLLNPVRLQAVSVTYYTLSTSLPLDAKQALIMWISQLLQSAPDAFKSANRVTTGSVTVQFTADDLEMPKFVKAVLNNYRMMPMDIF